MTKLLYTAEAHVVGGREAGHGRTSDGRLEVDLRLPPEMGGTEDAGTNPEQLFAVGYAACFEGALGAVARRRKVDLGDVAIDAKVGLVTTEERGFNVTRRARRHARRHRRSGARRRRSSMTPTRCARTRTPRAATSRSR